MTRQGVARVPLVPIPRIETVRLARTPAVGRPLLPSLTALARVGLAALIALSVVTATAAATGRTAVPLQALAAARTAAGFSEPAVPASFHSVATPPPLRVGTTMNMPFNAVVTDAAERTGA